MKVLLRGGHKVEKDTLRELWLAHLNSQTEKRTTNKLIWSEKEHQTWEDMTSQGKSPSEISKVIGTKTER